MSSARTIDYYEALGLHYGATMDEIKAAYRKMAMKWHPDHHQNDNPVEKMNAERMFKLINEAYQALKNGKGTYTDNTSYYREDSRAYSKQSRDNFYDNQDTGGWYDGGQDTGYQGSGGWNSGWNSGRQPRPRRNWQWNIDWPDLSGVVEFLVMILKPLIIVAAVCFGLWMVFKVICIILHMIWPILLIGGIVTAGVFVARYFLF